MGLGGIETARDSNHSLPQMLFAALEAVDASYFSRLSFSFGLKTTDASVTGRPKTLIGLWV